MTRRVLFLCTGNYYRSRFAEELFNHLAAEGLPGWTADSRALALEIGVCNQGPISAHTQQALVLHGINVAEPVRHPKQVSEEDLSSTTLIVALKETEHRPYLTQRYPAWPDRVTYWHIHDLDKATAAQALTEIADRVTQLIAELKK